MRAKLENLALQHKNQSFFCYELALPTFDFFWHYHPEYELTYIINGSGKRIVGDNYEDFTDQDLVLLGPMLPHTWVTEKPASDQYRVIVIQFSTECIQPLLQYSEMAVIKQLLNRSDRGVQFSGLQKKEVADILNEMVESNGMDALLLFFKLLQKLSNMEYRALASGFFTSYQTNENQQRMNTVFKWVQQKYTGKIQLSEAASLIHLSESAFCKFFKRVSGKTFSGYVNDIRIAHACKLLIETDLSVLQIANNSGFDSLTYFNRTFLIKKGITPRGFRKKQ
jgi:AraC-like DNA-binding protein